MTPEEEAHIFQNCLSGEIAEVPEISEDTFMDVRLHAAKDNGLTLSYAPAAFDKLAMLEARLTTMEPAHLPELLRAIAGKPELERELAHMAALRDHGWPFEPRASWSSCRNRLAEYFPERIVETESTGPDGKQRRNVRARADGLYYHLQFCQQELSLICITDPELVKASRPQHCLREDENADLTCLEGVMKFFHHLPKAESVESTEPPFSCFQPPPVPAPLMDTRPDWIRNLAGEDLKTYRHLLMHTDKEVLKRMNLRRHEVASLVAFAALRPQIEADTEVQAIMHKDKKKMFLATVGLPKKPASDRASIIRTVHDIIRMEFGLPRTTLDGSEDLVADLLATADDMHLLRLNLSSRLRINFRTEHWKGVHTVADLEAKVLHLSEHPDHSPREGLPESAIDQLLERTAAAFGGLRKSLELTAQKAAQTIEAELVNCAPADS